MKIYLARHTETNYNVAQLCNSDPSVDVHLTEKGIEQANRLAEKLQTVDWEAVYVSELPRTHQTAEVINKGRDKEIIVNSRLNDNKTGFEGKPINEYFAALEQSGDIFGTSFNDGESYNDAAERVNKFLDDLKTKNYKTIIIVTHGFIAQAIAAYAQRKDVSELVEFAIPQGSYIELEL